LWIECAWNWWLCCDVLIRYLAGSTLEDLALSEHLVDEGRQYVLIDAFFLFAIPLC
jgi:hypothetical protein